MIDHDSIEITEDLIDAALEGGIEAPHDESSSGSKERADTRERGNRCPALFLMSKGSKQAGWEWEQREEGTQTPDFAYASSVARRVACCPQREHSWMPKATRTAARTMRTTRIQRTAIVAARPMLEREAAAVRDSSFSGVSRLLPSYRSTRARWKPARVAVWSARRLASAASASAASAASAAPRRVRDSDRSICAQSLSWSRASACCAASRSRSRPLMNIRRRCAYCVPVPSSSPRVLSTSTVRAPSNGAPSVVSSLSVISCFFLFSEIETEKKKR